jgi:hypothetical protein
LLLCKTHKFVYIRIPKTGSSSCALYLLHSGLIEDTDICGNKDAGAVKAMLRHQQNSEYQSAEIIGNNYGHAKHSEILIDYPFCKEYVSIATVRNPADRVLSAGVMLSSKDKSPETIYRNIEFVLRSNMIFSIEQSRFVSEKTILWPTEKMGLKVEEFIASRGGKIEKHWQALKTGSGEYADVIDQSLMNKIENRYSNDFDLWERAMSCG